ncbi:hypothetical protein M408DRAFT_329763 [Serendipita vermifera MAFF 305830]|uniref:F-box domain-containing protein n=1 Tax=Serendipita vermifera MAFF 305830 TaxID=933852 RepID=A0A0C3B6P7_SERVB|nr:hypothetical protein M408DRAFT_329763 [Serendipita vermifera MAFF 305830]
MLVCKSWSQAALDTTQLWSTFKILNDFDFWVACIPRRLARTRKDGLLDIHIWVGRPPCLSQEEPDESRLKGTPDVAELRIAYNSILRSLTGIHGEVARRWRIFRVVDYYAGSGMWDKPSKLAEYLVFPTPHLKELHLYNVVSSRDILPETPLLKTLQAWSVNVPSFPNLKAATSVRIRYCTNFSVALADATHLESLSVEFSLNDSLKVDYPNLHTLQLSGCPESTALDGLSAPSLRSLGLQFSVPSALPVVLSCKGLPFNHIEFLDVSFESPTGNPISYVEHTRRLLSATTKLRTLKLSGMLATSLVLKLLESECQSLWQDRDLKLDLDGTEYTLRPGEDRSLLLKEHLGEVSSGICGSWEEASSFLSWYLGMEITPVS